MLPAWLTLDLLKKAFPYIAIVLFVAGLLGAVYHYGSNHGEAVIQAKWDKQKAADAVFVDAQKKQIAVKEDAHNAQDTKINSDLSDLQTKNATLIAGIQSDTADRVRDEARRDSLYRAASEGSATQRANLASYAAQLDAALTTGIGLVSELQETVAVRDGQLKDLGAQILNDRTLLDTTSTVTTNDPGEKKNVSSGQLEPAH